MVTAQAPAPRTRAAPPPFVAHCTELLSPLGAVRVGRMFGGWGFYVDGLFIALIAHERLYLKSDDETRPRFAAAGSEPFSYTARGSEKMVTSYWSAPDEAMDAPAAMAPWARLAIAAALRARTAPKARRAAPTPAGTASVTPPPAPAKRGASRPRAASRPGGSRGGAR